MTYIPRHIERTPEMHPLTWRMRDDKQPVWIDEYRSKNGYVGAEKALKGMAQEEIVNLVKDAGLKGRGGAGFSTGLKWSLMPKDESMNIRYLLCGGRHVDLGIRAEILPWLHLPAWRIHRSGSESASCDCGSHRSRPAG